MIASTEAEAQRLARETERAVGPRGRAQAAVRPVRRARLLAPAARPPARAGDFPPPSSVEAARSRTEVILSLVRREQADAAAIAGEPRRRARPFHPAGTPEQIADMIEDWFTDGAADGFNIMPPLLPAMLDVFSAEVIPLLQRRGLFRRPMRARRCASITACLAEERVQGRRAAGDVAGAGFSAYRPRSGGPTGGSLGREADPRRTSIIAKSDFGYREVNWPGRL